MQDAELDRLKTDEAALRKELESAGVQFRGKTCRCPFHDDRSPSAGIYQKDGRWYFKCQVCQAGGDIIDVRAMLNKRSVADELKALREQGQPRTTARPARAPAPAKAPKLYPSIEAARETLQRLEQFANFEGMYRYTDPDTGATDMVVLRFRDADGKKNFVQASAAPGGFVLKAPEGKLPLYNRARLRPASDVVVVEGEKCVHALQEIGIAATTSPGGALKGDHADWSPLAGKRVYLWPDFDPVNPPDRPMPGERTGYVHMRQVQEILAKLDPPAEVFWIDPEPLELGPKGDAADFVERYPDWAPEEIRGLIQADVLGDAKPVGPAAQYLEYLEAGIAGKRRPVPFPWKNLTYCSRALMPGTVTCWVGDPSCGKSFGIVQCLAYWLTHDIKACAYMLEDSLESHLARAHAQIEKESHITDPLWLEDNGWFARESYKRCRPLLDKMGRSISCSPDEQVSQDRLVDWVEERAREWHRVIVIDPVTAAVVEKNPWAADCAFIWRVKVICRKYGCSVIFVVHPRKGTKGKKGGGGGDLDDMAGGAAYGRFSHTVIWWELHEAAAPVMVRGKPGWPAEELHFNRAAKVAKARNGPGNKKRIAFSFEGSSLTFNELGLIDAT